MSNNHSSKYDENGRPIKKGLFSNNSNEKRTHNYSRGHRNIETRNHSKKNNSPNHFKGKNIVSAWGYSLILILLLSSFGIIPGYIFVLVFLIPIFYVIRKISSNQDYVNKENNLVYDENSNIIYNIDKNDKD